MSNIKFITGSQDIFLKDVVKSTKEELIIVSPWIKNYGAKIIIDNLKTLKINLLVYTRINFLEFAKGISDLEAIKLLYNSFPNLVINCIQNLHSKVYISDKTTALLTSGNLTMGGMKNNVETGIIIKDFDLVSDLSESLITSLNQSLKLTIDDFEQAQKNVPLEEIKSKLRETDISKDDVYKFNKSSLILGTRIIPQKEASTSINSIEEKYGIELITENAESGQDILLESYGETILKQLSQFIPELTKINVNQLKIAFVHPSYNNSKISSADLETQHRLNSLGKVLHTTLLRLNINAKYKDDYYPMFSDILCDYLAYQFENGDLFKQLKLEDLILHNNNDSNNINKMLFDCKLIFLAIIYLNFGFNYTNNIYSKYNPINFESNFESVFLYDPKSTVMELIQYYLKVTPTYKVLSETGASHKKLFELGLVINGKINAKGRGSSIQNGEKNAAKNFLLSEKYNKYYKKWLSSKLNSMKKTVIGKLNISPQRDYNLRKLCKKIDVDGSALLLLNTALINELWCKEHSISKDYSYSSLHTGGAYVLNLFYKERVFNKLTIPTVKMTEIENSLHELKPKFFDKLDLSAYALHGKYEENLTHNQKINYFNSVLYVKYLISGYDETVNLLDKLFGDMIEDCINSYSEKAFDLKGLLQQYTQMDGLGQIPEYKLVSVSGKDDSPQYTSQVYINKKLVGTGVGGSVKEAEKLAAKAAVEVLGIN